MLNKKLKKILRLEKGLTSLEKVHLVRENSQTGLTLIEVLIALLVTLVLFLALMQSALLSISSNTKNILRDEAVSIAEERMRELRGLPFDHADLTAGVVGPEALPPRDFRNFQQAFTRTITIINLPDGNTKQISVRITWDYQEKTIAGGNPYVHTITSIKRRL